HAARIVADLSNLSDLRLFVEVIRHGNFVRTATELGMSPSYVSKRIGLLEAELGVRLLHRTSRQVSATPQGEKTYEWARGILDRVRQMQDALAEDASEPRGSLRVSSSFRLGRNHVPPASSSPAPRSPPPHASLPALAPPRDPPTHAR